MPIAEVKSSMVAFVWSVARHKDYVEVDLYRPGAEDRITLRLRPQEAADLGEILTKRAAEE